MTTPTTPPESRHARDRDRAVAEITTVYVKTGGGVAAADRVYHYNPDCRYGPRTGHREWDRETAEEWGLDPCSYCGHRRRGDRR